MINFTDLQEVRCKHVFFTLVKLFMNSCLPSGFVWFHQYLLGFHLMLNSHLSASRGKLKFKLGLTETSIMIIQIYDSDYDSLN